MRVDDYYATGKRWWVRLHEKGGKRHEMPCHHNLEAYLGTYLEAARLWDGKKSPLFRSARGRHRRADRKSDAPRVWAPEQCLTFVGVQSAFLEGRYFRGKSCAAVFRF
jgi:hypothetical protein